MSISADDYVRGLEIRIKGLLAKIEDQALDVARMKKALRWMADNPGAHPTNVVVVARDGLGDHR